MSLTAHLLTHPIHQIRSVVNPLVSQLLQRLANLVEIVKKGLGDIDLPIRETLG